MCPNCSTEADPFYCVNCEKMKQKAKKKSAQPKIKTLWQKLAENNHYLTYPKKEKE